MMVQACADTAAVATASIDHLVTLADGAASIKWIQSGFRPSVSPGPFPTPRNLLGFKDGTADPRPGTPAFASTVWVSKAEQPPWLRDGTYLCVRRIRTDVKAWNHVTVQDQEVVIGRYKNGAPLSGGTEFSPLRLRQTKAEGQLAIPVDSHVRLASSQENRGATMFRRGYSYNNGTDDNGVQDEGLLFLAYVKDVEHQFVRNSESYCSPRPSQFVCHSDR